MTINENLTEFAGKPVEDWQPDIKQFDPAKYHYRIRLEYEDEEAHVLWVDRLAQYLEQAGADKTTGLVVGMWGHEWAGGMNTADEVVQGLVSARDKLPNLKALFMGDIVVEESEISWIEQGDISPLFNAYANLEILAARGGNHLRLGKVQHPRLKQLIIQSGGLRREIVEDAIMADLPELEHLELWLGSAGYGSDTIPEHLAPLFSGERYPRLKYLGLRDCEYADELAGVLANAPIVERLEVLDLSLGNMGDMGAASLAKGKYTGKLKKLDIHHHFCSDEVLAELKKLPIEVDASERQTEHEWNDERFRFIAVSE